MAIGIYLSHLWGGDPADQISYEDNAFGTNWAGHETLVQIIIIIAYWNTVKANTAAGIFALFLSLPVAIPEYCDGTPPNNRKG